MSGKENEFIIMYFIFRLNIMKTFENLTYSMLKYLPSTQSLLMAFFDLKEMGYHIKNLILHWKYDL